MRKSLVLGVSPLLAVMACAGASNQTVSTGSQPAADQPAAAQSAASTHSSTCTSSQLRLRLGQPNGAAGSTYRPVIFTNRGSSACTLFGYPGVSYVAPQTGKQVGAAATRNTQHPSRIVTLRPGGHASAVVQLTNYTDYDTARCQPTKVSGLRVYPPGSRHAMYVAFGQDQMACSTNVHQLSVEAVVRGTTGM